MSKILCEKLNNIIDIDQVKAIVDSHRIELGFHSMQSFIDSFNKREIIIAKCDGLVVGFTRYHHRKDGKTTLYEIAVVPNYRYLNVGKGLINALKKECESIGSRSIRLSCPVELSSNSFYKKIGFTQILRRSRPGKNRPLYEWEFQILPFQPIVFVASMTASGYDLNELIRIWEKEAKCQKPFKRCIITPLFIGPKGLDCIKYIHDQWGIEVIFDSGGFFVQQGKISYDELFTKLMDFYHKNEWAETYVLPDYVPTSRESVAEVNERVYVTAAEGVRFFKRLPPYLRERSLGVLQGHTPDHLKFCYEEYMNNGIKQIGFGSFDTGGVNAEINLLTDRAAQRLGFVRDLIRTHYAEKRIKQLPGLHLFGVSSPNIINQFQGYLATSFDSSGWQRTAGFGNIYLPFQGRRNVTHGASAVSSGSGLRADEFYALCEKLNHTCPFCKDFSRLQRDRFARMWHNALVFDEMTYSLNKSEVRKGL